MREEEEEKTDLPLMERRKGEMKEGELKGKEVSYEGSRRRNTYD